MAYDTMTLEVYKFAASYLGGFMGKGSGPSQLDALDTVKLIGISRKIVEFLKGVNDDRVAVRLGSSLDEVANKLEVQIKLRAEYNPNLVVAANRFTEHGMERGVPYTSAAIYYYAGERLVGFVDERIEDRSVDQAMYEHCNNLKERITGFLKMYIERFNDSPTPSLRLQYPVTDIRNDGLCAICKSIESSLIPQLREAITNLDAALLRMKEHARQNVQPV